MTAESHDEVSSLPAPELEEGFRSEVSGVSEELIHYSRLRMVTTLMLLPLSIYLFLFLLE